MGEITRTNGSKSILDDFPVVNYDMKKGLEVMPLSLIFVGMITFNNLCLQYVQVSFCKFPHLVQSSQRFLLLHISSSILQTTLHGVFHWSSM
jgi:hypothetical protein